MRLFLSWLAFICGTYIIQSSLLPLVAYNGISPDLLLLLVVSLGFLQGRRLGVFIGFLVGLLQDLVTGSFFGVNIFSKMLLGYASGVFSNRVFKEQAFLPLFASILASMINYFVILLIMVLLGYRFNLAAHLQSVLLPMVWYNVLLAVPMHRFVSVMCERLTEKK
jgi:rod shape-determining protein MreD